MDVFLTRCRISMCQGLGPKKHDELSEIDRTAVLLLGIPDVWGNLELADGP